MPKNIDEKKSDHLETNLAPKTPEVLDVGHEKEDLSVEQEPDQQELRQAMEKLGLDDGAPAQASASDESTVRQAGGPKQEEKVRKLMDVAKEKGVVFAVAMAKKLNDPYVLDMFHDALAAQGLYKKFKE